MFVWFLTSFYGIHIATIGMGFIFSLSWLWVIIGFPFLIVPIFWISHSIPSLLRVLFIKIYGVSWFCCIVHSLAGVVGVVGIIMFYRESPPVLVIGDESFFILRGMWKAAPFKTVFIATPFMGIVISILWSSIIAPIYIKLSGVQISDIEKDNQNP